MAKLNIMIGFPGSGKSSYARKYLLTNKSVYLSSDQIRVDMYGFEDQTHNSEVFERMKKETILALQNGFDVIYDATNLIRKRREALIKDIKSKTQNIEINAYLCCTPINIVLERNMTRTERHLPWDKLEQMIKSIEVPMYYEGYNNIMLIDGGMYNDIYDYNFLIKDCEGYSQDNPHHNETLAEHIKAVTKNAIELYEIGKSLRLNIDREILRQAARYHDFGKLYTRLYNDKKGYFVYYGHERISAYIYLCHIRKQRMVDGLDRVRLCDSDYQVAALILNHMEWYHREDMNAIKERFNDEDLYTMLELLHEADLRGRNEYARMVTEL